MRILLLPLAVVLLAACAIGPGEPTLSQKSARPVTADASRGKPLYDRYCAPCHGDTGLGDGPLADEFDPRPTDLVAPGVRISVKGIEVVIQTPHYSTRVLTDRVATGNREMPAWDEVLTPQEIDDVIAYVRELIEAHAATQQPR